MYELTLYCYGPFSRSLLRSFHKRQQNQRTRLIHPQCHSLSKNTGKNGLPPSWLVCSVIHSRDTHLKTIIPKLIRPTRPRNYLARFKYRSSSLCPLYTTRNYPHPIPRRKTFPMLRLGSLVFPLPTNNILVSHILCIFRPSWSYVTLTDNLPLLSWSWLLLTFHCYRHDSLVPPEIALTFCSSDHT